MPGIRQWFIRAALAMLIVSATSGCGRTFRGGIVQPNPLDMPTETLRESEEIVIVTGDMELNLPVAQVTREGDIQVSRHYPLRNVASFTVVSRDRLRFHVQIEHKWLDWADLSTWRVYLVDDRGRRYEPETLERARANHLATMWDYEQRSVIRDRYGDVVYVRRDGHLRRNALGSLSVFRGSGDFVFYGRNIFTPDIEGLTLVLERTTTAFNFTWRFSDDDTGSGPPGMRGSAPITMVRLSER